MPSLTPVEAADRMSRRRPIGLAVAALIFLMIQVVASPFFDTRVSGSALRQNFWAINATALILILAGIAFTSSGAWFRKDEVLDLVNDDVSRLHAHSAIGLGFWVAMITAMTLFVVPAFANLTAREAVYLVVTPSIAMALLFFSWLEYRANSDA